MVKKYMHMKCRGKILPDLPHPLEPTTAKLMLIPPVALLVFDWLKLLLLLFIMVSISIQLC